MIARLDLPKTPAALKQNTIKDPQRYKVQEGDATMTHIAS